MALSIAETLSFAERSGGGLINYWPKHSKSGQEAVDEGKRRADEVVTFMRCESSPITLPFIGEAVAKSGQWGLLERTFFHRLGEHLLP